MLVAYNLRRLINILGQNELEKYLKEILSFFQLKKLPLKLKKHILSYLACKTNILAVFNLVVKPLILKPLNKFKRGI